MTENSATAMSRRRLLTMIGLSAGSAAMYQAMNSLGLARPNPISQGPIRLGAAPQGASVLVLGRRHGRAWWPPTNCATPATRCRCSNTTSARAAATGRCAAATAIPNWAAQTQECGFDPELVHQSRARGACRITTAACSATASGSESRSKPFVQVNHNAYLHSRKAFGGKPQRLRTVKADYQGHVAELLAKAAQSRALDAEVSAEDRAILLELAAHLGRARQELPVTSKAPTSSDRRGYATRSGRRPERAAAYFGAGGLERSAEIAPLGRACHRRHVRHANDACFSRSAAWAGSARPSARTRRR